MFEGNMALNQGRNNESVEISDDINLGFTDDLFLNYIENPRARDIMALQHVKEDVVELLARHTVSNLTKLLLKHIERLVVNLELGESVILEINMVSVRGLLPG